MTRALVIKTYGDKQIAEAIANGVEKGREQSEAKKLERTAALVRVAVGNNKTAEDYACLVQKSRYEHQVSRNHCRLYGAVWGLIGVMVLTVDGLYKYLSAINREA